MTCTFHAPGLALELPAPAGDALDAALALAAHEPLLQALDAWLSRAPDWQPGTPPAAPPFWAAAEGGARLGADWATLARAGGPPPPLQWPELEFEVEVAAFDAAPRPADGGPGLLLLPPSFEAPWRAVLHGPGLVAEAEWRGPGHALALCAPPEPAPPARAPWRVVLAAACRRPLPDWLGWSAPPSPVAGAQAWLAGPEGRQAGRIVPALGGFGLLLD